MNVKVPQPTVEKPLTAIDYIAVLDQCSKLEEVAQYAQACPEAIRNDERFTRAVAKRLSVIKTNQGRVHERAR